MDDHVLVIWSAPRGPFIRSDQIQTAAETRASLEQMRLPASTKQSCEIQKGALEISKGLLQSTI